MNWHSPRFRLSLLVVFIVLIVGVGLAFLYVRAVTHPDITGGIPPLPTPGPARTTYTNTQFGYTIQYPTQWHLTSSSDNSFVRVFEGYDAALPEAAAFEIRCVANPNRLDARTMWQQTEPPKSSETGVGPVTFSSGVSAYVAKGQGQTPYTLYTLVNNQVACQALTPETDSLNAQVVLTTLNSFRWQ